MDAAFHDGYVRRRVGPSTLQAPDTLPKCGAEERLQLGMPAQDDLKDRILWVELVRDLARCDQGGHFNMPAMFWVRPSLSGHTHHEVREVLNSHDASV